MPAAQTQPTHGEPVFNHPEVKVLYEYDLTIPAEIYDSILKLDRHTLVEDLEKIILDAIAWYPIYTNGEDDFDETKQSYIWHALFMLTDLKAEESLPVLLEVLRQEEAFFDFYFADGLTDFFWQFIYELGQHQLRMLLEFLYETEIYAFAKTEVSVALLQVALWQPARKAEVETVYKELLVFLSQPENEPLIFEDDFVGLSIGDMEDGKFEGLKKELTAFYKIYPEMKAIANEWSERSEDQSEMLKMHMGTEPRPFQTREEIYQFFHTNENEPDDLLDEGEE